jgi:hypothetical protein
MLTISRSQMNLLEQIAFQQYEQRLILHIREHFPGHAGYLGDQGLLRFIRHSCELAEKHGFETERDLCLYTDLTIMLGIGFDSDPQLEWTREILEDPLLVDPRSRMEDLWDQAMLYMERVLGPDGVFPQHPYQVARRLRLARTSPVTDSNENTLISYFHDLWPEKTRYVDATALCAMIGKSKEAAACYGIRHELGQIEFSIHAFLFGHLFHADPLYPWITDILNGDRAIDGHEKIHQMVSTFDAYLSTALR